MTVVRRFLLASSLARLIARDRGSTPITEGYFAGQQGRISYVALHSERAYLVLIQEPTVAAPAEERTEIPRGHAEALLEVCAGRLTLERSALAIEGGSEVLIERITEPGPLNTVTVEFHNGEEAEAFTPPAWFGPEITTEPSFGRQLISLNQMPDVGEVQLSGSIVEAVLDILESQADEQPVATPARLRAVETSVLDALRRLSASTLVEPQTAPPDAEAAETPMHDADHRGPDAPEAQEALSEPAERDQAQPTDADAPSRPSKIRPRLFPRLTH
jgi:CYTH domain-containing protein